MCGINGFFNFSRSAMALDEALVGRMNTAIAHRGPDGDGVWSDRARGIYLGHRRLSILDLSDNGRQPMAGPEGTVIVYNGEIYNFRELRAGLDGEPPRSGTDTEVLLRLYARDGVRCLDELNGMFAFALWDPRQGKLFLARDRIGIKPLYYTVSNGIFAFSSEIKALLTLPWIRPQLDEQALYHFLTFSDLAAPDTMFRGIHKLHPGHSLVVGAGGIEQSGPYWEVSYGAELPAGEEELCADLLQAFRRSTRYQMVSDVPVGAFLSGGVDSSAVVGVMSELSTAPVRTFSVGFADAPGYDERVYAAGIARRFGTEHHERIVVREEIVEFLPKIVDIYDEPLADPTSIPIYFIAQLARQTGTKVILTGDGSDELFCGYRGWMRYQRTHRLYDLLAGAPGPVRAAAAGLAGLIDESSVAHEMLKRASKRQEFFWGGAVGLKESAKRAILSPDYRARMGGFDLHAHVAALRQNFVRLAPPERRADIVDWMVFTGVKDIVPNQYMYRADRMGMAHGVELRVPFLDHHFVTMATSLASRWKVRGGEPKYLLKKALEPILPKETLYRRKQGFNVPLREWMQQAVVSHIERRAAGFCADTGLFSREGIDVLVAQSRAGSANVASSLWNIFFLMSWFDRWLR